MIFLVAEDVVSNFSGDTVIESLIPDMFASKTSFAACLTRLS